MIVAIHQPNYIPWLGYFAKMALADIFVFLDDAQFSRGSYTNRVQIARAGQPAWLTIPVVHKLGTPICHTLPAKPDWPRAHLDTLKQSYRTAAHFAEIWTYLEAILRGVEGTLGHTNATIVAGLAKGLGLQPNFMQSSALPFPPDLDADERLARIVSNLAPGGTYLSGAGGAKYQADSTFAAHGVKLAYSAFNPETYDRGGENFIPGLSIVDALFHLGWAETAKLIRPRS